MASTHRCQAPGCTGTASERCFECARWFCNEHRIIVRIPNATGWFRQELCETCLAEYVLAVRRVNGSTAVLRPALEVMLLE